MKARPFTPPPNGLIAFNNNGYLCYGVFLGITPENRIKVYTPDQAVRFVQINISDQNDYECHFLPYDYQELRQKARSWWKGFVIEVAGKRYVVTTAHRSPPKYKTVLVHYRDEKNLKRSVLLKDPKLKFVGHV